MGISLGTTIKIIGLVLTVIGIGFAVWSYQLSGSVSSPITQAVTGAITDNVMTYYILVPSVLLSACIFFVKIDLKNILRLYKVRF